MGGHYMRQNESTRTPGNLAFVDVSYREEAIDHNRKRLVFERAVACRMRLRKGQAVREEWECFDSQESFWAWLEAGSEAHRPTWLFCHRTATVLSLLKFWGRLSDKRYTFQAPPKKRKAVKGKADDRPDRKGFAILEGPPTLLKVFAADDKCFVICDTLNYWKRTIQELAKDLGYLLPPDDVEPGSSKWQEELCGARVDVIRKAVLGLMQRIQSQDLGNWKGTAPGLAMNCFRHRFMTRKILIDQNPEASAICRAAYFGGQVRLGFQGICMSDAALAGRQDTSYRPLDYPLLRSKIYKVDVRSAYAWAMLHQFHPYHLEGIEKSVSVENLWHMTKHWWAAAIAQINTDSVAYPLKRPGGVEYVRGTFWTGLCGDELEEALRLGHVKNVACAAIYRKDLLFANYVRYWYDEKMSAEVAKDYSRYGLAKLMLNSLYGRFGMKSARWIDRPDIDPPKDYGAFGEIDPRDSKFKLFRSVGWWAQERVEEGEHPEALPAIAASITAAVRVRMRKLWAMAGEKGVVYQDTDSLHLTESGYERMLYGDVGWGLEAGDLRVEGEADTAWYRGHRNYQFAGKEVVSGLRPEYVTVAPGELEHTITQGLESILGGPTNGCIESTRERFRLQEGSRVGTVDRNGWVHPDTVVSGDMPVGIIGTILPDDFNLGIQAPAPIGAGKLGEPLADTVTDPITPLPNPLEGLARRRKDDSTTKE